MSKIPGCLLFLALSLPAPVDAQQIAAAAATRLEPAGKWTVEYADWQCVLHRNYLTDAKPAHLALTLEPLTPVAWLRIASEGKDIARDDREDAILIRDQQRAPGTFHYNIFSAKSHQIREYMFDLDQQPIGAVQNSFRLWTRKHGDLEVRADGFQNAWKATRTRMTDLYAKLGINEADVNAMVKPPKGDVFKFVSLPGGAKSLELAYLYWVDTRGRIDDCRLVQPSGIKRLDAQLCADLKAKARFDPARDAAGRAIRVPMFVHAILRTARV